MNLQTATYNTRTRMSKERLAELENGIEKIKWDINGLSEVRRGSTSLRSIRYGYNFYNM